MREQAEEDRYDQRKNLSFIRHGIAQKAVAQVIFDDPDELSLLQEGRFGLLKDCKDELKADNLRTNHVVADWLVTIGLLFTFDWELDDVSEDENCILKSGLSFLRHLKVRWRWVFLAIEGRALDKMLFLALNWVKWMLGLFTVHISSITAHHAPAISSSLQPKLVLDIDLWYDVLRILLYWVDLKRLDLVLESLSLVLDLFDVFFIHFITLTMCLSFFGLALSFQSINSGLVQTYIINHVLNKAVDVLILIGKGHLHSAVVCRGRFLGDSWYPGLCVGIRRPCLLALFSHSGQLIISIATLAQHIASTILWPQWIASTIQFVNVESVLTSISDVCIHLGKYGVDHLRQSCLCSVAIDRRCRWQMDCILRLEHLHQGALVHFRIDSDRNR